MDRQYIFGLNTRLAKAIENVLEITLYRLSLCFVLGLSLHPTISFSLLLLQSSLSMISFFSIYKDKNESNKDKNESTLSHWRGDQVHFCNIYKFEIKDICEYIKVVNFFYKIIGTVPAKIN